MRNLFLTDQRSFSSTWENVTHRFVSVIKIDISSRKATTYTAVGRTLEIDPSTGEVVCNSAYEDGGTLGGALHQTRKEELERLKFQYKLSPWFYKDLSNEVKYTIDAVSIQAGVANRCFSVSPQIDVNIQASIFVENSPNGSSVQVFIEGGIDNFPAFEAYAKVNEANVLSLLQSDPPPGNTPFDLRNPLITLDGKSGLRPVSGIALFGGFNKSEQGNGKSKERLRNQLFPLHE